MACGFGSADVGVEARDRVVQRLHDDRCSAQHLRRWRASIGDHDGRHACGERAEHAGVRVLEHHALRRRDRQAGGGFEEDVRSGLAARDLVAADDRVQARGEARVRALEVRHWGARLGRDQWRGYGGWVVEREGKRLLIGGDTADTRAFRDHRQHGPYELAVMPIGAYDPWITNHCTPEQAIAMADAAGARLIVPVHHQTFSLSREPVMDPIERAVKALDAERGRLGLTAIGETLHLAG